MADRATTLFEELLAEQAGRSRPPVEQWHPEREGRIDIRIARDGTWYHEGDPIRREALVRLFSTILRREGDSHYLVTPVEKLAIEVDVAPFVAVRLERDGEGADQRLLLTTNVGEHVVIDDAHRLAMVPVGDEVLPLVEVRDGLQALVTRPVYYELAEYALETAEASASGPDVPGVYSSGSYFPLAAP